MQTITDHVFWDTTWRSALATTVPGPDEPTWYNDLDESKVEFLDPLLPRRGAALEVGCGSARLLARIGRRYPLRLVALDCSPSAIDLAHETAAAFEVAIEPVLGDVESLPFPDRSFDLVLSGGLLEHFADPRPTLAESLRVLKPGGVLAATVVPRKLVSLHRPLHRWLGPKVFRSAFRPLDYRRWLEELGCVDVCVQSRGLYPPFVHHLPAGIRRRVVSLCRPLDGSRLADALGYYFLVAGRMAA